MRSTMTSRRQPLIRQCRRRRAPVVAPIDDPIDDDDVDLDDLVDVPPESVKSPIDRLAEAFPGSELIDERS